MSTSERADTARFKEQIRAEWTEEATVVAWRRWHPQLAIAGRGATGAIVEAARVKPGMRVLDLASGTGEPALTLARAVGPAGHVTATDLGPGMLKAAEENAKQAGLTNLTFREADAHQLPFPDESFDRVTCRFGVYYFADVGQALREIRRVLRPGGLAALTALGPLERNPLSLSFLEPFLKRVVVPPPPPGAPHPFKFAEQGSLARELERAGFRQVEEEFRTMVDAFHENGIEVWLDVVYNHTSEGDLTGPTYSYRGIDNPSYYLLTGELVFEPGTQGIVTSFEITRIEPYRNDGELVSENVSISAPVKLPNGGTVQKDLVITMRRYTGQWIVTAIADAPSRPGSPSTPRP